MTDIGPVGLLVIIANVLISYKGFTNYSFFESYKFEVDNVLIKKDYLRLISSGFLHINWMHLIFNMLTLYAFSRLLEFQLGSFYFFLIYFVSLICGNLLALMVHKQHGDYSAVGASGAVCGIVFASIALFPGMKVGIFGLPILIHSWEYGILFVAYSIYGVKSQKDNIGHEAHLGGALAGMLLAIFLQPDSLSENIFTILIVIVPTIIFIYLIITRPQVLFIDNFYFKSHNKNYNVDHKYNSAKATRQHELDKLLDKINNKGIDSLSKSEKKKLKDYSK